MHSTNQIRRRIYLDNKIQGAMLISLLILEVGLIAAGIVFLYDRYRQIIEDNLYRIHAVSGAPTMLESMLAALGEVVLFIFAVNVLALIVADRLWVLYIRSVLSGIRTQLDGIGNLDFEFGAQDRWGRHPVLDAVMGWRESERRRLREICRELERASTAELSEKEFREALQFAAFRIRGNLPADTASIPAGQTANREAVNDASV